MPFLDTPASTNKNSFLYSSDEDEDDVEIVFDDSSDEELSEEDQGSDGSLLTNRRISKLDEVVSGSPKEEKSTYELIERLKEDAATNNITLTHKRFKDKNEYILFPDKENFIKYQLLALNKALDNSNLGSLDILFDGENTTLEMYKDRLLSILAGNFWSIHRIEKKLSELDDGEYAGGLEGLVPLNDMYEISVFDEDTMECPICCETVTDFIRTPFVKVEGCTEHLACKDCYVLYLRNKISESFSVPCIGGTCRKYISYSSIRRFDSTYIESLVKYSLIQSFNDAINTNVNRCPEQECGNIILTKQESDIYLSSKTNLEAVSCLSWHKFCLTCKKESHSPITCTLLKQWFKKIDDGNESLNWVLNNTQPCPGCDVDIEKVDGCNHMKCGFCQHEFCWICNREWSGHGGSFYDCVNKRDMDSKKEKNTQTDSFNRFRNYYKFFIESENNMLLDMRLFQKLTAKKLNNLSSMFGLSFVELEFLNECVRELIQARNMIKYSFAFLYFMDQSHNLFFIFTHNQMALLSKIDEVSSLLVDINVNSTLPNSKRDIKVLQMKPYLIQSTSILKKLQTNLAKCGLDLVARKLDIYS